YSYDQKVADEIEFLKKGAQHKNEIITEEKIERLPPPIKRWMIQSGVVGKREPSLVHITQRGALRSKENDAWAEFTAQQCFSLKPPAFVWKANIQMNEIIEIEGRDKLENGHGNMLIKAESIFPIANALGKEIDQATFVRFLAEISWFPQAALKDYITWKALDSNSAEAAFSYGKYFGYRYFYFQ
ncbi:MAG TPA: DUF6544 family protein, partial [Cyclobacteriaceae bacterium]|nr:DUF6544 family protein [Cyclobacteriaceae bacterium]